MDGAGKTAPNLRMLEIFNIISNHDGVMTTAELTTKLGWPKQTVHRLISSLHDEGYLERQGRFLAPSHHMLSMANGLLQSRNSFNTRHHVLNEISELTEETVNLVMPQNDGMRYVDRVDTNWHFRILLPVGTHVPFHCTASGKTYMAFMRSDQRKRFVAGLKMDTYTQNTHDNPDTLHEELKEVKKLGYAVDNEEFYDNMFAIAVPVFDNEGRYCAALAVHGPRTRFDRDAAMAVVDNLKSASQRITAIMFGDDSNTDSSSVALDSAVGHTSNQDR